MLKKVHRLTKQKDFDYVFKRGRASYSKILGIKTAKNNLDYNRFGMMVSNKVSKKAVERNKIKRQLRAVVKLALNNLKSGYDCVIITSPSILGKSYAEIEVTVNKSFSKLHLYKDTLN